MMMRTSGRSAAGLTTADFVAKPFASAVETKSIQVGWEIRPYPKTSCIADDAAALVAHQCGIFLLLSRLGRAGRVNEVFSPGNHRCSQDRLAFFVANEATNRDSVLQLER